MRCKKIRTMLTALVNGWLSIILLASASIQAQEMPEEGKVLNRQLFLPIVMSDDSGVFLDEAEETQATDDSLVAEEGEQMIHAADSATEAAAMASAVTTTPTLVFSGVVATSGDEQVTGFPDSRKLVCDSSGALYAALRYKQGNNYRIFVQKRNANGLWAATNYGQALDTAVSPWHRRVPSIAQDASGLLHVTWYAATGSSEHERQIYYARSADQGQTWTTAPAPVVSISGYIAPAGLWQEHPVIHAASNGVIYLAWEGGDATYRNDHQIKMLKSLDQGRSWLPVSTNTNYNIKPEHLSHFARPTVVTTNQGRTVWVFAAREGSISTGARRVRIVATQSTNGGPWSNWTTIANIGTTGQRHVSVAVDSLGQLHAVWRQAVVLSGIHYAKVYYSFAKVVGGVWQWNTAKVIAGSQTPSYQFFPTLTVDGQNRVWVAWNETNDPSKFTQAGSYEEAPTTGKIRLAVQVNGVWRLYGLPNPTPSESIRDIYPSFRTSACPGTNGVDLIWTRYNNSATSPHKVYHMRLQ